MRHRLMLSAIAALAWFVTGASEAHAPMSTIRNPGFYRLNIGDMQLTALNDGVVSYSIPEVLPGTQASEIEKFSQDSGYDGPVGMSYNGFLVNTGTRLILFDTGSGRKLDNERFFHGSGHLMAALRASGYSPEQVDDVYITHRGQDHIGGLSIHGRAAFPHAIVHAPKTEFGMFLDRKKLAKLAAQSGSNAGLQKWIDFTRDCFAPYVRSGRLDLFEGAPSFAGGVQALPTPGHTPGHTSYVISSNGQTLLILGDLILSPMQFANPSLTSSFDVDRSAAALQRERILGVAARDHGWIAGGHISFPGVGKVNHAGNRFTFLPPQFAQPDDDPKSR